MSQLNIPWVHILIACLELSDTSIIAFQENWSKAVCDRYILFPEAVKCVNNFVIGCMLVIVSVYTRVSDLNFVPNTVIFVMRLYAIYSRSVTVAVIGGCLLAGETAVKIVRVLLSHSGVLIQVWFGSGRSLMGRVWICLQVHLGQPRIGCKK